MNVSFDSRVSGELSPFPSTKIVNAGEEEAEPHVHLDPDPGFSMQVSLQNQVIGVRVAGDLDRYTSFLFTMALKRLERLEIPTITVDLSELEFIDNSGLAALREARQRADQTARTFNAKRPSPRVRRFLILAGEGALLTPTPAGGSLPMGFRRLGHVAERY